MPILRPHLLLLSLAAALLVIQLARAEKTWDMGVEAVQWRETLPSGHLFVEEKGARLKAGLNWPLTELGTINIDYRGTVYLSVVHHSGDDPSRVVIPNRYESSIKVGQIGTAQFLRASFMLPATPSLRPFLEGGIDIWYRPLDYYEIWEIPSVKLGIEFASKTPKELTITAGVAKTIGSRNQIQTTHSPWNANENVALKLGDSIEPFFNLAWKWDKRSLLSLRYERYRFGASPVIPLSSGIGVFQPATTIDSIGLFYVQQF